MPRTGRKPDAELRNDLRIGKPGGNLQTLAQASLQFRLVDTVGPLPGRHLSRGPKLGAVFHINQRFERDQLYAQFRPKMTQPFL